MNHCLLNAWLEKAFGGWRGDRGDRGERMQRGGERDFS